MTVIYEVTCRDVPAYRRFFTTRDRALVHVEFVARQLGIGTHDFVVTGHKVDD